MAHAHALRREGASQPQSTAGGVRELHDDSDARAFPENDFDFPPTLHPGRELFTFSVFVVMTVTVVVWGGWKLISLI